MTLKDLAVFAADNVVIRVYKDLNHSFPKAPGGFDHDAAAVLIDRVG